MMPPLLRDATFRRFWTGQTVSLVGDQVSLFAVPLTAVLVLNANAAQMGLLTAAGLLPSLLFSLAAGAAIDRHGRRRRTMLVTDVGRAVLMATIPISYALGRLGLPQLYAVTFAVGTLDVLFFVAYSGLFVSVVPPQGYVQGQSLLNGSRAMSFVVGQGGAGVLVAALTAPGAIIVDALSFLVSGLALARIHPAEPSTAEPGKGDLAAGVRFIAGSRMVRSALGATATVNFFTLAFNAIVILYATRALHVRPAMLGLVLGSGAPSVACSGRASPDASPGVSGSARRSSPDACCSRRRSRSFRWRAARTPWCSRACSPRSSVPAQASCCSTSQSARSSPA